MTSISVTLAVAGILGLIYVGLSLNVSKARRASHVSLGDGNEAAPALQIAIRMHGNFAEYVPLALILLGGIEASGAAHWLVGLLGVLLICGRAVHPLGLIRPAPNPFRVCGAVLTWVVIIWASLDALLIAL